MNLRKLWAAAVIALLPVTLIAQDSGTRLDGSARRLDASPVSASSGGLTNGRVALSNGSTQVTDDAGLTYNKTTDVLTSGAVTAKNITATGLATPGGITVTPTLTQVGSITTVAAGWRANGLLTVVAGSALLDGETFVLSDGTHVPQSFEFDVANDGVVGGRVEIDIAGTETPAEVGALCAAAIDATTSATFTYDAIDNLDGTVALWNTTWAAAGNTAQSETVADAGFVVTNMTGGVDAGIIDGDYLTIKYSLAGTVPLEFDTGDGTTGGRIPVLFTGTETADDIRDLLITALNAAAPTQLTASSGGEATVSIVLDTPGAVGDTNTENVANAGFAVTGFANPTAATTYTYKLVARLSDGSTTEAGAASTTAAGHATLSASNFNALSWAAVSGAASYDVYRTVGAATQGKIASATTALTLIDTGLAGGGETVPTIDTTGLVSTDHLRVGTSATAGHVLTMDANGYATPQAASGGISGLTTGYVPKATSPTTIGDSGIAESGNTYSLGANKSGTNTAPDGKTIVGNLGTGNATSGTLVFQTGVPQASGATQHVPATALTLTNSGTGGTSAPQVLLPDGTAAAPSFAWASSSNSGMYRYNGSRTAFVGNGSKLFGIGPGEFHIDRTTVPSGIGFSQNLFSFSADAYLSSPAAATLQLGQAASATPVAQTLGAQGGSGTNIAGQPRVYRGSLGTGSADPGALIDRTGYPGSTGTTVHTESSRRYVSGHWTALTAGAATGFATLTYGASTSIGAEFFVTVRAGDASNRQGMSYRVAVNSVRDAAGNTQSVAAVIGTPPVAAGSGTLTCTFDVAEGASAATLRANCASSLTETFLDANFQVIANGPGLTVGTL